MPSQLHQELRVASKALKAASIGALACLPHLCSKVCLKAVRPHHELCTHAHTHTHTRTRVLLVVV